MKRKFLIVACSLTYLLGCTLPVSASNNVGKTSYEVISINEDILPQNISLQTRSLQTRGVSLIYDHTSGTKSRDKYITRYCWGRTQVKQGNINLTSYTRARYEGILGGIKGDSGRKWSKVEGGPSYAESGEVDADIGSQWVAHTYYGITE